MERMRPEEFRQWLEQRTRKFAVCVFRFLDALPVSVSSKVIGHQLGKSASSIGANYREATRAESRDDFVHKVSIALKEASESVYWLEILGDLRAVERLAAQKVVLHPAKLENGEFPLAVRQISGAIARRIVCPVTPGKSYEKGYKYFYNK